MGRLCVFQEFLRVLVIDRQQRTRSQIPEEQRQPESANGDRNHQVEPVEVKTAVEVRLDVPEQIHKPHKDKPTREPDQLARIALKAPRKQEQERNRKMK